MARPFTSLSPSIEHRLNTWQQVQRRLLTGQRPRIRPTVTLSRAFGCEAFPLAEHLRGALEAQTGETWLVHDKILLEAVASAEHLPLEHLKKLGFVTKGFETLWLGPTDYYEQQNELDAMSKALVQVAQLGNAIIVGRAGAALTQNLKNCFHFRLEASHAFRVRSISERLGINLKEAEEQVKANTEARDRFWARQLKVDLGKVTLYDAVFNNERHGIPEISAAIVAYLEKAWPEPALFAPQAISA